MLGTERLEELITRLSPFWDDKEILQRIADEQGNSPEFLEKFSLVFSEAYSKAVEMKLIDSETVWKTNQPLINLLFYISFRNAARINEASFKTSCDIETGVFSRDYIDEHLLALFPPLSFPLERNPVQKCHGVIMVGIKDADALREKCEKEVYSLILKKIAHIAQGLVSWPRDKIARYDENRLVLVMSQLSPDSEKSLGICQNRAKSISDWVKVVVHKSVYDDTRQKVNEVEIETSALVFCHPNIQLKNNFDLVKRVYLPLIKILPASPPKP